MADGITITVLGVKELQVQIDRLARALGAAAVEPVLLDGANIVANAARVKARYDSERTEGIHLRDAIVAKTLKTRILNEPRPAIAAVDRKKAPHAYMVEHGTGERIGKRGKYRGRRFGRMPAQPFMRPAWNENKERVLQGIARDLGTLLDRAAGK